MRKPKVGDEVAFFDGRHERLATVTAVAAETWHCDLQLVGPPARRLKRVEIQSFGKIKYARRWQWPDSTDR
jgi:hypothetical protein